MSQEVSPSPAGDFKAARNRQYSRHETQITNAVFLEFDTGLYGLMPTSENPLGISKLKGGMSIRFIEAFTTVAQSDLL